MRYYLTCTISSPQFWGSLLWPENALTKSIPHKYIFFWHKSITVLSCYLLCYWPSPLAVLPGPLLLTVVFFSICTGRKTPIRTCFMPHEHRHCVLLANLGGAQAGAKGVTTKKNMAKRQGFSSDSTNRMLVHDC